MDKLRWSLDALYKSFKDEKFLNDLSECDKYIKKYNDFVDKCVQNHDDEKNKLDEYIKLSKYGKTLFSKIFIYAELTLSVETKNSEASKNLEIIENKNSELSKAESKMTKWIGEIKDISLLSKDSDLIKEHEFILSEKKEKSRYVLNEKEEEIISKLRSTGSDAWSKLKDLVTSNLTVDIKIDGEEKHLPLTVVRNMAFSDDADLRKNAYEAELASYKKIEDTAAACLNGIKGEVITVDKLRGYDSPLDETLKNSRMDRETLDAMFKAMKESFPVFRKYLRRKGEMLGYKNGLPFYDLFAPVSKSNKKYSYEEAKKMVLDNYGAFSEKLKNFAKKAMDNRWIDVMPREGKVAGAFCENIIALGESRVMTNFGGNFEDVVTIAHELGHGYHGECLRGESILNCDYPMPLAESASTFCETIVKKAAMKQSSKEEAFSILETEISDDTQVIIDIYSRFLFEDKVFQKRKESSLTANELNDIMVWAQKEAYGDGLDKDYLHPYMWICKPHYYYADANYYNFPYAFGLLFSKGLYAKYLEEGDKFLPEYDNVLRCAGKMKIYDAAKLAGIDIHDVNFFRSSLKLVEDDINEFIKLSNDMF